MGYELKTFKVDTVTNQRFKEECAKLNVRQSGILELLMIKWVKMRKISEKRRANIYPNTLKDGKNQEESINGVG